MDLICKRRGTCALYTAKVYIKDDNMYGSECPYELGPCPKNCKFYKEVEVVVEEDYSEYLPF